MSQEEAKNDGPVFHLSDTFSSAFFGKVPGKVSENADPAHDAKLISNFIDLLTNPDKRELRGEALNTLRKAKAQQFLVDLIANPDLEKHQKELVMACWECGLDFSAHLIFFSQLVKNCGYPVALEAITVIDEMHDLSDNLKLEKAIETLSSPVLSPEKQALVFDVLERLRSLKN